MKVTLIKKSKAGHENKGCTKNVALVSGQCLSVEIDGQEMSCLTEASRKLTGTYNETGAGIFTLDACKREFRSNRGHVVVNLEPCHSGQSFPALEAALRCNVLAVKNALNALPPRYTFEIDVDEI